MALAETEPLRAKRVPFYDQAVKYGLTGIEKVPDLLDLYRLLSQIYERQELPDKAAEILNLAVANNPKAAEAYIIKAGPFIAKGDVDAAEKILKDGVAQAGSGFRLDIALGELALRRRDTELARDFFQRAVEADPKQEAGYLRLSGVHRMEGARDKALEVLQKGMVELPDSAALKAEVADVQLEMGNLDKAEEVIVALEADGKSKPMVAYLRGKKALLGRQIRQAITYLEQADQASASPQARLLLGRAYLMADELGAAEQALDRLTTSYPTFVPAWRSLAEVQLRLRQFDRAASSANLVLQSAPDDTEMRLLLAQTYIARNLINEALREATIAAQRSKDTPDPYLLMAEVYARQKDNAKAEANYRQALEVAKEKARVYERLIRFFRDTGQEDKLKVVLDEARKVLPEEESIILSGTPDEIEKELLARTASPEATPPDWLGLARLYQMTDRADKAKDAYKQVLAKAEPASANWRNAWQQVFLLHLASDEYAAARDLIAQLSKADADAPELLFAAPLILLAEDKLDEATVQLRKVTEDYPTLSQGHFLLGQVLARRRKYDEAIVALGKALAARPNLIPARLLLGRIYHSQGNYSGALDQANEAVKYSPRFVPALELQATSYAGLGNWDKALEARKQVAQVVPDNVLNLVSLAALHLQQHQPREAEAVFAAAQKLAPDAPLLVRSYADFLADTGRRPQGEKLIDDYVARHPDDGNAYVLKGEFVSKVAGPEAAEPLFRKASELDPKDARPLLFLGDQYSRMAQWAKAAEVYQEAAKRDPANAVPKKRLADVYMLQNKVAEARRVIEEVIKADPSDAAAYVVAGRVAARQGNVDEARTLIEKALSLAPDYGEAKVRLAELFAGPNPMKALDLLATVDPSDLSFEKALLLRADINTRRAQLTEAILDLRRLLDFRPTSVAGRMQLAAKYLANKEPGRASELLKSLSGERLDKDASLLVALGDSQSRASNFQEALATYEKARGVDPTSADALTGEALALVSLNRKKEALERIYHVMNVNEKEVWPRLALVAVYEKTDELEKAFEVLRTGLLQSPQWERGYVYLADLLVRAERVDEARQILLTGLQRVPTSIAIRAGLAALEIGGQGAEAAVKILKPLVEEFEARYGTTPDRLEALRPYMTSVRVYSLALYNLGRVDDSLKWGMMLYGLDPTDVANANNMAWVLATEKKDFIRAREMIATVLRLMPNHPQVLDTAGWIAFMEGKHDEAIEMFNASIRYGDNAEAHYHMGRVFEDQQRIEEARTQYEKALEMKLAGKERLECEKRLTALAGTPK
jgi:tetratricopeptide (TPR) repeat protein